MKIDLFLNQCIKLPQFMSVCKDCVIYSDGYKKKIFPQVRVAIKRESRNPSGLQIAVASERFCFHFHFLSR